MARAGLSGDDGRLAPECMGPRAYHTLPHWREAGPIRLCYATVERSSKCGVVRGRWDGASSGKAS